MAALNRLVIVRLLLRSLLVQASWNYRTMQGAGLGFAMIPALVRVYRGDGAALAKALRAHSGFFNAHPYLSTVAIAALARMESESTSPDQVERFKRAIVSPLGSLGDRLVWARWRPLCSLLAFLIFLLGAPWWVAVAAFLVSYNAVHLWLRIWGVRLGWREGREVGRALTGSPLRRLPDRLTIPLAVVGGAVVPLMGLALGGGAGIGPLSTIGVALALAIAGYVRPRLAGRLAVLGLFVGSLMFVILGTSAW
ncbi:MAG: PTS system mannose/fructose/sorbose family transporter subunit IID [Gemmatimonadales bacterium]|jgi:PTS system mannose-specific IID component